MKRLNIKIKFTELGWQVRISSLKGTYVSLSYFLNFKEVLTYVTEYVTRFKYFYPSCEDINIKFIGC